MVTSILHLLIWSVKEGAHSLDTSIMSHLHVCLNFQIQPGIAISPPKVQHAPSCSPFYTDDLTHTSWEMPAHDVCITAEQRLRGHVWTVLFELFCLCIRWLGMSALITFISVSQRKIGFKEPESLFSQTPQITNVEIDVSSSIPRLSCCPGPPFTNTV